MSIGTYRESIETDSSCGTRADAPAPRLRPGVLVQHRAGLPNDCTPLFDTGILATTVIEDVVGRPLASETRYRVAKITVIRQNVFNLDDPDENNAVFRFANRWHVNTREGVVRELLLFREGEAVTGNIVAESERLLRAKSYLYDARVVANRLCNIRGEDSDVEVDLVVVTRDVWSLSPELSVTRTGGEHRLQTGFSEINLAGFRRPSRLHGVRQPGPRRCQLELQRCKPRRQPRRFQSPLRRHRRRGKSRSPDRPTVLRFRRPPRVASELPPSQHRAGPLRRGRAHLRVRPGLSAGAGLDGLVQGPRGRLDQPSEHRRHLERLATNGDRERGSRVAEPQVPLSVDRLSAHSGRIRPGPQRGPRADHGGHLPGTPVRRAARLLAPRRRPYRRQRGISGRPPGRRTTASCVTAHAPRATGIPGPLRPRT